MTLSTEAWSAAFNRARALETRSRTSWLWTEYADDPIGFSKHVLGRVAESGDHSGHEGAEYLIRSLWTHKRVACRSARKFSKTHSFGDIATAALFTAPSIVLVLAPTDRQVQTGAMAQIKAAIEGAPEATRRRIHEHARILDREIKIGPQHYLLAFSTDSPDRAHGFHAGVEVPPDPRADMTREEYDAFLAAVKAAGKAKSSRLFILIDEAAAEVYRKIFDALRGSMQGPSVYVMLVANPTIASDDPHPFARAFEEGSGWHRIHFGHRDDPDPDPVDARFNAGYHGPDRSEGPRYGLPVWLRDDDWIAATARDWGERSPMFRAHVLGQFAPIDLPWALLTAEDMLKCHGNVPGIDFGRHIGVDLGFGGADPCVAALWHDGVKLAEYVWEGADPEDNMGRILRLMESWGRPAGTPLPAENVHLDSCGEGGATYKLLRKYGHAVDGVDFGGSPRGYWSRQLEDNTRYRNLRTEIHVHLARMVKAGWVGMDRTKYRDSFQQALWAQLDPKTINAPTGQQVEPKEQIRKRHGRSPDNWDADLYAWCRAPSYKPFVWGGKRRRRRYIPSSPKWH